MKKCLLFILIPVLAISCGGNNQSTKAKVVSPEDQELLTKAQVLFKVLPSEAPNPENPVTDAKVKLGKILYYDNNLSNEHSQSCNTCHNLATYGVDNLPTSPGDNSIPGTRNSPTVYNAALKGLQFWDGRNKDVEEQAGGPIMNPAEMGMPHEDFVMDRVIESEFYPALFAAAFPEEENPVNFKNLRYAIAAFERTLLTPAPFDKYLAGDHEAISQEAKTGLKTFMDVGCTACHSGALLGGQMFMKFPMFGEYSDYLPGKVDYGKFEATQVESDKFMYYVPQLRNVEKTGPYFHTGGIASLEEANHIMAKSELNKELTPEQLSSLTAFMHTLTGEVKDDWKVVPEELN